MRIARQNIFGETWEDVIDASMRCLAFLLMAGMAASLLSPAKLDTKYIDLIRLILLLACGLFVVRSFWQIVAQIRKRGWSHAAVVALAFTCLAAGIILIAGLGLAVYLHMP